MSENSLINLGELSKPATVLVEKISEAIGGLFKPVQIRRIARAEAEAGRIRVQSDIQLSELKLRAAQRITVEEAMKQRNMESIASMALPDLDSAAKPDRVGTDWIVNFFDKARLISENEMQFVWAKLLAGEANHPGTYSKRTVNYLASLDSRDAQDFSTLCRFLWTVDGERLPLVLDKKSHFYLDVGVTHDVLQHLDDIGLIRYQYPMIVQRAPSGMRFRASYFGEIVELEYSALARGGLDRGIVLLTKIGMELASLCGSEPVPGFLEYALGKWVEDRELIPSSSYPRSSGKPVESVLR